MSVIVTNLKFFTYAIIDFQAIQFVDRKSVFSKLRNLKTFISKTTKRSNEVYSIFYKHSIDFIYLIMY